MENKTEIKTPSKKKYYLELIKRKTLVFLNLIFFILILIGLLWGLFYVMLFFIILIGLAYLFNAIRK